MKNLIPLLLSNDFDAIVSTDAPDYLLEYAINTKLRKKLYTLLKNKEKKSTRILKALIKEKNYKIKNEYILNVYDTFDISGLYKKNKISILPDEYVKEFKEQEYDENKIIKIIKHINREDNINNISYTELEIYKNTFINNFIYILYLLEAQEPLNIQHRKFIVFLLSFCRKNSKIKNIDNNFIYLLKYKRYNNMFLFLQYNYFYYFFNFIVYFYYKELSDINKYNEIIIGCENKWLEWRISGYPKDQSIEVNDKYFKKDKNLIDKAKKEIIKFNRNNIKDKHNKNNEIEKWYEERNKLFCSKK